MKRRHETAAESSSPKRMIVPSSEEEVLEEAVYEWNWDRFLEDTTLKRMPRPLPMSDVLASRVPASQGLDMPLLQHLRPLFKGHQDKDYNKDEDNADSNAIPVDDIDDSSLSTLTRGQHARYLQLESGSESWNEARRKEFRKLSQKVRQEQELYRQALETFWDSHRDVFKNGLDTNVARYCVAYAQCYQANYRGPLHFGRESQAISLQQVSKASFTNARINHTNFTLDSISSRVVHQAPAHDMRNTVEDWESAVPSFDESKMHLTLLENDVHALQLARQYKASIVTTHETLQTLLQVSGDDLSHWIIPITKRQDGITVLDLPVPRPTIPRECVSKGVREGLYQALESNGGGDVGFTYTLLTLPGKSSSLQVLVRSQQRLFTAATQQALCFHVQLEYFSNRGMEESSSYERACWILDTLVLKNPLLLVARVNPSSFRVLQWQQISVAHALAFSKRFVEMDPLNHVEAMIHVLQKIETCAIGSHVLVLQPSSTMISIHSACSDSNESEINLMEEFDKAQVVHTSAGHLRKCAQVWRWCHDRIPFTFPIKNDDERSNTKRKASAR